MTYRRTAFLATCIFVLGCSLVSRIGSGASSVDDQRTDGDGDHNSEADTLEDEEDIFEDGDAIAELISKLDHEQQRESPTATQPAMKPTTTEATSLNAFDTWALSDDECSNALKEAGIETRKPAFETPFVRTPRLLEGPINGVEIVPKWPRDKPVNAVMDCRLILALAQLAKFSRERGVAKVMFYSTYRPLTKPDQPCAKGKKGKKCRSRLKAYKKAVAGKMSQHRRATAIDIRWFVKQDGQVIDVLEHYERHPKSPPCDDDPKTDEGVFLKDLACALHETKTFNVMLTPNSNKDHHNHFHFDLTPEAKWYIIR